MRNMDQYLSLLHPFELKTIVDIRSISCIFSNVFHKDYKGRLEHHIEHELFFVEKGSQIVYENDKSYVINQGQAFLHKSNALHKDDANNVSTSVIIISFTSDSPALASLYDQVLNFSNEDILLIKDLFETIKKAGYFNINANYYYGQEIYSISNIYSVSSQRIKMSLETIFLNLLEKNTKKETKQKSVSRLTNQIKEELKNQMYSKLDLDIISKNLFYSRSYLCRKFKEDTDKTILQYFYEKKISEAKLLLINTQKTLQEITELLCFESVQYFNTVFKKYVGVSPKQWKKVVSKPFIQ